MDIVKTWKVMTKYLNVRGYSDIKFDEEKQIGKFKMLNGNDGFVVWIEDVLKKQEMITAIKKYLLNVDLSYNGKKIIMIYEKTTLPAIKNFNNDFSTQYDMEMIHVKHVVQNKFEHSLTPTYRILHGQEKDDCIRAYNGMHWEIKENDPISIVLNLKKGDLVEEKNDHDFSRSCVSKRPPMIFYRICT